MVGELTAISSPSSLDLVAVIFDGRLVDPSCSPSSSPSFCFFSVPGLTSSGSLLSWAFLGESVASNLFFSGSSPSPPLGLFLGVFGTAPGVCGSACVIAIPGVIGCGFSPGAGVTTPAATASVRAFISSSGASFSSVGCLYRCAWPACFMRIPCGL